MADERVLSEDQEDILNFKRKYEQEYGVLAPSAGSSQTANCQTSTSSSNNGHERRTGGDEVDGRLKGSSLPSTIPPETSSETSEQESYGEAPTADVKDTSFSWSSPSTKGVSTADDLIEPGSAPNVPYKTDGMYTIDYFNTYNL